MAQDVQKNLILGALENDQDAYTALYGQAQNAVKLTVYAILCPDGSNHADADDVILESMIKGFKSLDQLKNPDSYTAWMKSIARNKAIDYLRKNRALNFSEIGDDDFDFEETLIDKDESRRPELVMDKNAKAGLLQEILTGLPQEQRTVLVMYYYHDMKISEIAGELGCTEATVKSRLKYGKSKVEFGVNELQKKHGIKLYTVAPIVFFYWLFRDSESVYACGSEIFDKLFFRSGAASNTTTAGNTAGKTAGSVAGKAAAAGTSAGAKGILIKALAVVAALAVVGAGAAYAVQKNKAASGNNAEVVAEESEAKDTEEDTSTQDTEETEAIEVEHPEYAAYADILNDSSHEEFRKEAMYDEGRYRLTGLCFAKLLDMDNNGVDELILADGASDYADFTIQIWTYDNGSTSLIYEGGAFYDGDVYVEACLIKHNDNYYVKTGESTGLDDYSIYGYENGSFGEVKNIYIDVEDPDEGYYLDGEKISEEEYNNFLNEFVQYQEAYDFNYWTNESEGITTTETSESYYTNDPDKIKAMLDEVINTCNETAELIRD
jgi:RNA polymerase sigma factor (sigma-70 family)